MATVTKKELIDRIAESTQCKRADAKKVVQGFLDEIIRELGKGNRLEFRDFGVLEVKQRAARIAQNPKTLQRVPVPPKRTVKFKVGRLLKVSLDTDGAGFISGDDEGGGEAEQMQVQTKPTNVVVKARGETSDRTTAR